MSGPALLVIAATMVLGMVAGVLAGNACGGNLAVTFLVSASVGLIGGALSAVVDDI